MMNGINALRPQTGSQMGRGRIYVVKLDASNAKNPGPMESGMRGKGRHCRPTLDFQSLVREKQQRCS